MLRVTDELLNEIRRQGEEAYPGECCGIIAGRPDPVKEAVRLFPMENQRTDDPHRYLIDPVQLRRAEAEIRSSGWEILGYYHSHPDHAAKPSAFDTEHAWPWYSYVIVEVNRCRAAGLASWTLDPERQGMHPEALEILSEV